MWARINDDKVAEITDIDPVGRFHPSIAWVDVDETVEVGMVEINGAWSHPSPPELTVEEKRKQLQRDRDNALNSMIHTVEGAGDVQVRPQDIINFQTAISGGQSREWVMADNSVATLTVEQMQECLDSGMAQGAAIWDVYISALKELNS